MEIFKTGGKETMKKRRFAQLVLMITMLFCLTFGTVCAQAATTATTTTAKAAVNFVYCALPAEPIIRSSIFDFKRRQKT